MLTDAVLVDRVVAGSDEAFDELYRRHANAAWRLGQAVTGNSHDAADAVSEAFARVLQAVKAGRLQNGDAFRSYLLTATRNAALDGLRAGGKARPTGDDELGEVAAAGASPAEKVAGAEDAVLVAEAFRNLPERWRSVLWLTEVEGVATKDAADQLGLTANGTAQLAVRARAGLRERYLQAHVKGEARPACRFTMDHLGAYVGGGISPRDLAKVDQHLADCATCSARKHELDEVGTTLRRVALPIPLVLAGMSADRVRAALASSSRDHGPFAFVGRAVQLAKEPTPLMRRVVGASAAGVLAVGLLSLGLAQKADAPVAGLAAPQPVVTPASADLPEPAIAESVELPAGSTVTGGLAKVADSVADAAPARKTFSAPTGASSTAPSSLAASEDPAPAVSTGAGAASASPLAPVCNLLAILCPGGATGGTVPTPPAVPQIPVRAGVNIADHKVGVTAEVGTSPSAGATVDGQDVVAPAPAPEEPGVEIQLGPVTVPVPLPGL